MTIASLDPSGPPRTWSDLNAPRHAPTARPAGRDRAPFSVVTICFNDREGLRRTMDSVRAQDRQLFEWIVIDGASTDGTGDLLDRCRAMGATVVSEPDLGIFDAMNKGLALARGEYVNFLNSGDLLASANTLRDVHDALKGERPDFVYGDAIEFEDSNGHYKAARPHEYVFYSMFTHHQAMFYRRDKIQHGYDQSYRFAADWAFTSAFLRGAAAIKRLRFSICRFQRGGSTFTETNRRTLDRELWRIYREEMRLPWPAAAALYLVKTSINRARLALPGLYDSLRMAGPV